MSAEMTVEKRLDVLEQQVAELARRLTPDKAGLTWFDRVAGSFKDDPEFDEILRLGREIRMADLPLENSQAGS
jgi:hypothetical protein